MLCESLALAKMVVCRFCYRHFASLKGYVLHCRIHRNEPRCVFKCESAGCKQTFCTYSAFKGHFYRKHNAPTLSVLSDCGTSAIIAKFACAVPLCARQFQAVKELLSHLKEHLVEGRPVACPVTGCKSSFTLKSSFTAHMSRKHRDCSASTISEIYKEVTPQSSDDAFHDASQNLAPNDAPNNDLPENLNETFLRNMCMFYLKLQGQLLLPASTIQIIVEEMQNLHEIGQEYTLSKLHTLLREELSLTDDAIDKIEACLRDSDLFSKSHQGPLRSIYSRAQTFKSMFRYIEPTKVALGSDESLTQRFAYYIPVKQTLTNLLESDLWKNAISQSCDSDTDVLCDIKDGKICKSNKFFKENPGCLKLILYQDAFEIVNPLGSAKKKHKLLAVYFSVANLPVHVRSNTDHMSLVLLCGENDLKHFGPGKIFSELLQDLKDLEGNGITVGGETVKGALYCVAGDNLGSHSIGGFTENFSQSQYFCRYCEITRREFHDDPHVCGPQRNPDNYEAALGHLQAEGIRDIKGIKVNSVFNNLESFHVCQPGLPPCLGHDLFEGIVSYDVALFLKYFIKTKKWFTYSILNRRIKQFKYKGSDALTKPCSVNPVACKLSGQAVQNWNFLRLLPVLIGDKVQDPDDDVWQLTLQLKDVVDLVCAQKISVPQVAYLEITIQDYLDSRKGLFPENHLKPKHHYLRHYPALILKFGPLIRLWTMRFESKHAYFKRCARHLKNFKNICLTLSERHQMFQAYLSAGLGCSQLLHVKNSCTFVPSLYSDAIRHAVTDFGFSENDTCVSTDIQYKGTSYKKGDFLVTKNDESMEFGELVVILIQHNATVYFVLDMHTSEYHNEYHMYSVTKLTSQLLCLNITNLVDFYPLKSYIINGHRVIPLKHSILSQ